MKEKQYQQLNVETKKISDEGVIEGVFSTPTKDRHEELITSNSWKLENYIKNPVILWGHDYSQPAIGKAIEIGVDKWGNLVGKIKFAIKENPIAKTVFQLIKGGFMNAFSVGYIAHEAEYDQETDVVKHTNCELLEISVVNVPANALALAKQKGIDVSSISDTDTAKTSLNTDLSDEKQETIDNTRKEENTVENDEIEENDETEEDEGVIEEIEEELEDELFDEEIEELKKTLNNNIKQTIETLQKIKNFSKDTNEETDIEENKRSKLQENLDGQDTVKKLNRAIRILIKSKNNCKKKLLKIKLRK